MKKRISVQTQNFVSLLIALFFAFNATLTFAHPPTTIPGKIAYQGKLLENDLPVTGTRTIAFSIPGTGWMETHNNVSVTNGLYSVQLGRITPIPTAVFNSPTVSLEITVEGMTLSPQVELLSVPYAYKADDAAKIAGDSVSTTDPAVGQILKWDGEAWIPDDETGGEGSSQWTTSGSDIYYNDGKVGIGTTNTVISAAMEINSSTLGFLMPRMNSEQIASIYNPASGLQVFNTTDEKVYIYVAAESCWKELSYGLGTIEVEFAAIDMDGNVYQTVEIGNQVWMVENLKTTKYNDGTPINHVTDNTGWNGAISGAYCWYKNDAAYENPYGKLYNWYAVNTGKLCPAGWHVPTHGEWLTLTNYCGNESMAGILLKEAGTTHWMYANITPATNVTGFTGLPGGIRYADGTFYSMSYEGSLWSSTQASIPNAYLHKLTCNDIGFFGQTQHKLVGASVRCLKDN